MHAQSQLIRDALRLPALLALVLACALCQHIHARQSPPDLDATTVRSLMTEFALWDGREIPSPGFKAWKTLDEALKAQRVSREGREVLIAQCIEGDKNSPVWSDRWSATYEWLLSEYYAYYPDPLPIEHKAFQCPLNVVVSKNVAGARNWPAGMECPVYVSVSTVWRPDLGDDLQVIVEEVGGRMAVGSTLGGVYVQIPHLPAGQAEIHLHVSVGDRGGDGEFRHIQSQQAAFKLDVVEVPTKVQADDSGKMETGIRALVAKCAFERYTTTGGVPMRFLPKSMRVFRLNVPDVSETAAKSIGPEDAVSLKLTVLDRCGIARLHAFCAFAGETNCKNDELLVLRDGEEISEFTLRVEGDPVIALATRENQDHKWPDLIRMWNGVLHRVGPLNVKE